MNSDYKNHRVEDPTKISSRQEKQVKKYVHDYFEKAVSKKKDYDKKRAERRAKEGGSHASTAIASGEDVKKEDEDSDGGQDMAMSDDEDEKPKQELVTPVTPLDQLLIAEGLKRKRKTEDDPDAVKKADDEATPSKRLKSESPPPPPPPPPANELGIDAMEDSNEMPGNETRVSQLTDSSYSPFDNDEPMKESAYINIVCPPPPPPLSELNEVPEFNVANFSANDDIDIASDAHSLGTNNTPQIDIEDDEQYRMNDHGRDYPGNGHGHLPELRVQGSS